MNTNRVCRLSNINRSVWKQILFPNPIGSHKITSLPENKDELRQSVNECFCTNNKRKQKTLLQLSLASSSHFGCDVIEECCNGEIRESPGAHEILGIRPSRKYAVVTRLSPPSAHLIISAERAWGGPPLLP